MRSAVIISQLCRNMSCNDYRTLATGSSDMTDMSVVYIFRLPTHVDRSASSPITCSSPSNASRTR